MADLQSSRIELNSYFLLWLRWIVEDYKAQNCGKVGIYFKITDVLVSSFILENM